MPTKTAKIEKSETDKHLEKLQKLTNKYTAFKTWADFLKTAMGSGYAPTLNPSGRTKKNASEIIYLADAFDDFMKSIGLANRAWRGENRKDVEQNIEMDF
jgi:galactose-1-phosphate uridylyltransferase